MSLLSTIEAPLSISNAIRKASKATGADFSYLLKTAERESSFNTGAKAKTSSAAGLFQFIESTWLGTMKAAGDKLGLSKYTPHIFKTQSGRHYVPNQNLRKEILQLRHNPEVSAMMAGAFTQENSKFITSELGRNPTQGELYIAHFLGPKGASDLISMKDSKPNARADRHFHKAAHANKSIFYSRGKPRTVAQVYKVLVRDHAELQATAAAGTSPEAAVTPPKWKTAASPAKSSPASPRLASAQPRRLVVPDRASKPFAKPVVFFSYPPEKVQAPTQALVQKVSVQPPMPVPLDGFPGVEVVILPNPNHAPAAKSDQAIGLAGQKKSPISAPAKVAALTHTGLNIVPRTMTGAAPGSLGVWATIVHPPAVEQEAKAALQPAAANKTAKADEPEILPAKRWRASRSPGLLEQSSKRNSARPQIRMASAASHFKWDFWEQASLNSN